MQHAMSEITVIQTEEDKPFSKEEREILFQKISSDTGLSLKYFDNISRLEDEQITENISAEYHVIPQLAVRSLLQYPCVIPICKTYASSEVSGASDTESADLDAGSDHAETAFVAIQTQRLGRYKKKIAERYAMSYTPITSQIIMYYPDLLYCEEHKSSSNISWNDEYYRVSEGDNIEICGVLIDTTRPLVYKHADGNPGNMSILDRIKSGNFTPDYLHERLFARHELLSGFVSRNVKKFALGGDFVEHGPYCYFLFKNEAHLHSINKLLFQMFWYLTHTVDTDSILLWANALRDNQHFDKPSELYEYIRVKLHKSENAVTSIPEEPEQSALLKYMKDYEPLLGVHLISAQDMTNIGLYIEYVLLSYALNTEDKKTQTLYADRTQEALGRIIARRKHESQVREELSKGSVEVYQELMYRYIYIKKFGFESYAKMFPDEPKVTAEKLLYNGYKKILDLVDEKIKKTIIATKQRDDKYFEEMQHNTEPWVAISYKLRHAVTIEDRKKYYLALKPYIANKTKDDWLRSKRGFPIMCPHLREQIEMELKGLSDKEMHDLLMKYAGETPLYDAYYCKICGEPVTYNDTLDGLTSYEGDQNVAGYQDAQGALKEYTWKLANQVVRAFVEFKSLKTNKYMNQFVSSVVKGIYEVVVSIDKKINKVKTNSVEEIDNKRKIYTILYVWALLIKVILENTGKIKFTFQKDFAKVSSDVLFRKALSKISESQDVLLRKLSDMTATVLEESLYRAYNNLNALLTKSSLEEETQYDSTDAILLDPVYIYLRYVYLMQHAKDQKKGMMNISASMQDIIGKDMDYSRAPTVNLTDDSEYKKYFKLCYVAFREYLAGACAVPPYKTTFSQLERLHGVATSVYTPEYKKHVDRLQELQALEAKLHEQHKHRVPLPLGQLPFSKYRTFHVLQYPVQLLGVFYGKTAVKSEFVSASEFGNASSKFHKHRWQLNAYCTIKQYKGLGLQHYKPNTVKIHNIDPQSAKALSTSEEFSGLKLVDQICSVCHISRTQAEQTADMQKIFDEEQELVNFFNYYQYRCPMATSGQQKQGDVFHVYKHEKCTACEVTKEQLTNRDEKYYDKFRKKFQDTIVVRKRETIHVQPINIHADLSVDSKLAKTWKYNANTVVEVIAKTYDMISNKIKKNVYTNFWKNLGMVENQDYDKVLSGETQIAEITPELAEMRTSRVSAYTRQFVADYYTLLNYKNIVNPPYDIKILMDSVGTGALSSASNIPDLNENHELLEQIRYFYYNDPVQVANCTYENFMNLVLQSIQNLNRSGKKISTEFFIMSVLKLIKAEKSTSKLKDQKTASVEAAQKIDMKETLPESESQAFEGLTPSDAYSYSYEDVDYEGENEDLNT